MPSRSMSTFRACIAVEPEEAVAKYHKLPGKEANTKHLQGDSFAAQPKGINVTGHNDEIIVLKNIVMLADI